jgi:hypothetical protein
MAKHAAPPEPELCRCAFLPVPHDPRWPGHDQAEGG